MVIIYILILGISDFYAHKDCIRITHILSGQFLPAFQHFTDIIVHLIKLIPAAYIPIVKFITLIDPA